MFLDTPLNKISRIDKRHEASLKRLNITTVRDVLYHFPVRYSNISTIDPVKELEHGKESTVYGTIKNIKTRRSFRGHIPMSEATIIDIHGDSLRAVWFHQPYLAKMLYEGQIVKLSGKVSINDSKISLANPKVEKIPTLPIDSHKSLWNENNEQFEFGYPVYRETRGISSEWIYQVIKKIFVQPEFQNITDPIPEYIRKSLNLPSLQVSLIWMHTPKNEKDAEVARKRFAFEEILILQTAKKRTRLRYEKLFTQTPPINQFAVNDFISNLPFTLTGAQKKSIDTIVGDMNSNKPMERLLEGDVGSGKTAVAASVTYAMASTNPSGKTYGSMQVAYMAPTEVLAKQLFESFIEYFDHTGMKIGLITGKECRVYPSKSNGEKWTQISRRQLTKWITNGEIPIVVGTHALLTKSVIFKYLGLVIIDEQHRFGTNQRMTLARKEGHSPHYLSMTATPIPRTLALTVYGDLDLSLLDELPAGRKNILTEIIHESKREEVYEKIRKLLKEGRQCYIICPRIDDPDPDKANALQLASVKQEYKRLSEEIFPEYTVDMMHSKMSKINKDMVMDDFASGKIHILVSTSVIEVGVNVPNATSIIIEGSERFGLAQLHQLRGRVQRSSHQSYCYLFSGSNSDTTRERLNSLVKAKNGFELAEYDLAQRGAGDLLGAKQWGITDLGMEAIKNIKMVEAAREYASQLINEDPNLDNFPDLKKSIIQVEKKLHLE